MILRHWWTCRRPRRSTSMRYWNQVSWSLWCTPRRGVCLSLLVRGYCLIACYRVPVLHLSDEMVWVQAQAVNMGSVQTPARVWCHPLRQQRWESGALCKVINLTTRICTRKRSLRLMTFVWTWTSCWTAWNPTVELSNVLMLTDNGIGCRWKVEVSRYSLDTSMERAESTILLLLAFRDAYVSVVNYSAWMKFGDFYPPYSSLLGSVTGDLFNCVIPCHLIVALSCVMLNIDKMFAQVSF